MNNGPILDKIQWNKEAIEWAELHMQDQSICMPSCNKNGKIKTLKGQWK